MFRFVVDIRCLSAVQAARSFRVTYDQRSSQILQQHQQIELKRQQDTLKACRQFIQMQVSVDLCLVRSRLFFNVFVLCLLEVFCLSSVVQ